MQVQEILDATNDQLSQGRVFAMSRDYADWETDNVITVELFRNLGLALACVFVTVLILLANFLGKI